MIKEIHGRTGQSVQRSRVPMRLALVAKSHRMDRLWERLPMRLNRAMKTLANPRSISFVFLTATETQRLIWIAISATTPSDDLRYGGCRNGNDQLDDRTKTKSVFPYCPYTIAPSTGWWSLVAPLRWRSVPIYVNGGSYQPTAARD